MLKEKGLTGKASDLRLSLCEFCGCMTYTRMVYIGTGFYKPTEAEINKVCGKCGAKKRD